MCSKIQVVCFYDGESVCIKLDHGVVRGTLKAMKIDTNHLGLLKNTISARWWRFFEILQICIRACPMFEYLLT